MNLLKILVISLALLLTACGTTFNVSSTANPNEDLLVPCPKVDHKAPQDFGEVLENYSELLDLYTTCRIRHNGLIKFEREKK